MLYTDFWGLKFSPFANEERPGTFVPVRSASLAIARLRYSLGSGSGVSTLFGEAGIGKTRLTRVIIEEFAAARWTVGYLPNPFGTARDILAALNPSAAGLAEGAAFAALRAYLEGQALTRRPTLIAVDDVQAARGTDFLETLRTLLNIRGEGEGTLALLLVGQAGMERRLAAASGFDTQLAMRAVLEPMTDEEARLYILARLRAAGSAHGIFTRQAAERVVRLARGIPRQVNRLCEMSLIIAYGLEAERVSPDIVEMAAADLDVLPPGEASFLPWPHPAAEPEPQAEAKPEPEEEDILAGLPAGS